MRKRLLELAERGRRADDDGPQNVDQLGQCARRGKVYIRRVADFGSDCLPATMEGKNSVLPFEVVADMRPIRSISRRAPHDLNSFDRRAMCLLLKRKKTKDLLAIGKASNDRNCLCGTNESFGNIHRALQILRMFFDKARCIRVERAQRDKNRMLLIFAKRSFGKDAKPFTLLDKPAYTKECLKRLGGALRVPKRFGGGDADG